MMCFNLDTHFYTITITSNNLKCNNYMLFFLRALPASRHKKDHTHPNIGLYQCFWSKAFPTKEGIQPAPFLFFLSYLGHFPNVTEGKH